MDFFSGLYLSSVVRFSRVADFPEKGENWGLELGGVTLVIVTPNYLASS